MSDSDHQEILNPASDIVQSNESRTRYLKLAKEIAAFALSTDKVMGVAIYGSTIRQDENTPHDLDLVFLVGNDTAQKYLDVIAKNSSSMPVSTNEEQEKMGIAALDFMGFSDDQKAKIKSMIKESEAAGFVPSVDINMVSANPSPEYIKAYNQNTLDPNFLVYLSENALIYDAESDTFIKNPVYPESTTDELKRSAFERMKEIMHDPKYFNKLRSSLSFRRIIEKQRLKYGRNNPTNQG